MKMFRQIFIYMIIIASGVGCKCSQTSSTPDYEEALQNVSKVITQAPSSDRVAMALMTPEQMSATIRDALGVDNLWPGSEYDPIVDFFGVALGGVDFQSTFERDRSAKIQTLLVVRSLAMMTAFTVVGAESARSDGDKLVFTIVNMGADTPNDGGERWTSQVTDLYWRLLSREPTTDELAVIAEAFLAVGTGSNVTNNSDGSVSEWTGWGWVTVLYGILSTEEFWNL
jgi:hypothetical protein